MWTHGCSHNVSLGALESGTGTRSGDALEVSLAQIDASGGENKEGRARKVEKV